MPAPNAECSESSFVGQHVRFWTSRQNFKAGRVIAGSTRDFIAAKSLEAPVVDTLSPIRQAACRIVVHEHLKRAWLVRISPSPRHDLSFPNWAREHRDRPRVTGAHAGALLCPRLALAAAGVGFEVAQRLVDRRRPRRPTACPKSKGSVGFPHGMSCPRFCPVCPDHRPDRAPIKKHRRRCPLDKIHIGFAPKTRPRLRPSPSLTRLIRRATHLSKREDRICPCGVERALDSMSF